MEYRCSTCKVYFESQEDNFNKNSSTGNGYHHICKKCQKKHNDKWKKSHPVGYKKLTEKHNEKRNEKQKEGLYFEKQKQYREENQEEINTKQRERRYFEKLGKIAAKLHGGLYYVDKSGDWMNSEERIISKTDLNEKIE